MVRQKVRQACNVDSIKGRLLSELTAVKERAGEAAKATNSYSLLRSNFRPFALMIDLERCIEAICNEENVVPISKVNDFINSIVNNNDTPFIYEKAGNTYTHFMIDEFQDTSLLQWNTSALLHDAIAQQQAARYCCGDVSSRSTVGVAAMAHTEREGRARFQLGQ